MLNIGDSEYDLDKAYNSVTGKRDKCLRVKVFFLHFHVHNDAQKGCPIARKQI